jgi:hypothetical protein
MLHRQFPASVTQATICSYFWAGIAVGSSHYQSAKDWAFSIIEALDAPPIEIIEIATANDRNSTMDALEAASDGADQQAAGRWLLTDLHHQLTVGDISALDAIRAAMRVVQIAGLPIEIYFDFDALDDELQLSDNGVYSSPAAVRLNVLDALVEHSGAT